MKKLTVKVWAAISHKGKTWTLDDCARGKNDMYPPDDAQYVRGTLTVDLPAPKKEKAKAKAKK
jgi:hypothetical protein